jgi:hypothetical protein
MWEEQCPTCGTLRFQSCPVYEQPTGSSYQGLIGSSLRLTSPKHKIRNNVRFVSRKSNASPAPSKQQQILVAVFNRTSSDLPSDEVHRIRTRGGLSEAPSTLLQIPGSTSVNLVFIRLVWLGSICLLTNFFQLPVVHANPIHPGGAFDAPAVYDNPLRWLLEEFIVGVINEVVLSLIGLSACLGVSITFNTRKCLQGEHPARKATAGLAFASILLVLMLPALPTSPFQRSVAQTLVGIRH